MSAKKTKKKETTLDEGIVNEPAAKSVSGSKSISLTEYNKTAPFSFNSKNYRLLLIGLAINILGFLLMIGGGTDDPTKFNADELFSTTRITIAPILIVAGYVVIMLSIMKRPKSDQK